MGDIAIDGGMGTVLTALGSTFRGTANFTTEEDTITDFWSEENPIAPEESVVSEPGLKQVQWSLIDIDPANMQRVFGGEVTGDRWDAPRDIIELEQSIEIHTAYDVLIEIPRAKVTARIVWNLTRTEIAQVAITARILIPSKADEPPFSIDKFEEE